MPLSRVKAGAAEPLGDALMLLKGMLPNQITNLISFTRSYTIHLVSNCPIRYRDGNHHRFYSRQSRNFFLLYRLRQPALSFPHQHLVFLPFDLQTFRSDTDLPEPISNLCSSTSLFFTPASSRHRPSPRPFLTPFAPSLCGWGQEGEGRNRVAIATTCGRDLPDPGSGTASVP